MRDYGKIKKRLSELTEILDEEAEHHSSYSCSLAAVYNCIYSISALRFPFSYIAVSPFFFKINIRWGLMRPEKPRKFVEKFKQRIGINITYPDIGSPDKMANYLDPILMSGGIVAVSINLRSSVFDNVDIDDDYWHFQLIVGKSPNGRYRLFCTYQGKYYEVDYLYLQYMVDTKFNYRNGSCFTPFMHFDVGDNAHASLNEIDEKVNLLSALYFYDLEHNLEEVDYYVQQLEGKYLSPADDLDMRNEIFLVNGGQQVIANGRRQYLKLLSEAFGDIPQDLLSIADRWEHLAASVTMLIGRKDPSEYSIFRQKLIDLIRFEWSAGQQFLDKYSHLYTVTDWPQVMLPKSQAKINFPDANAIA